MDFTETKLRRNPIEEANPISKLFFLWILPLFQKGYKQDLTFPDLYNIIKEDHAETLGNHLETAWTKELKNAKEVGKKPKLAKVLAKLFWKKLLLQTCFYCFDAWVIAVSQPILLRALIQSVNDGKENSWESYVYAAGICFATLLHAMILHPTVFSLFHMGMKYRVASSALIYRKALKLSKASQGDASVGKLVNLLSNDVNRFDTNMNFLPFMIAGPIQFIIFVYFLWDAIGVACFVGLGFIILMLPLMYVNGKYSAKYRLSISKRTDERGKLMNEIIVGMRVIKQYAWEQPFSMLIDKIRKLEVAELRKRSYLRGILLSVIFFAPKFIAYVTFVSFVLLGNDMSSEKVFFTMVSLNTVVQITLHFMPAAAAGLGEVIVTVNRIEEFLSLDEQKNGEIIHPVKESGPEIVFDHVTASWTKDKVTLDDISLNLKGAKLVIVVGGVGSGKTSFLNTLIAELPASKGKICVYGTTSYASQEAWIFEGNLRQNVLFGQPFDSERYYATVKACALEQDLVQLPFSDMTIVGERGVALSGGQKARVNMARALYRKADIYLLDDPLSAVDARVSRHIFEQCIRNHLAGSLRILVTHQLQYLPQADHIIVLNQGQIMAQGTYDYLVSNGIDFVSLMTSEASADEAIRKLSVVHQDEKRESKVSQPEKRTETMNAGTVTAKTYYEYFRMAKSTFGFIFLVVVLLMGQIFLSGNDYWLSYWSNSEDRKTGCIDVESTSCEDDYLGRDTYLLVYTGFNLGAVILNLIRAIWFYVFCTKISVHLHNSMFTSMVRAPTSFFDTNPSGRVMNRFTKDIGAIDEMLPFAFGETVSIFLNLFGVLTVVIIANYFLGVPVIIILVAFYFIRRYFVTTARDLKRIESISRSPLYTHVAATLQGLATIRSSNTQNILINQFDGHQDMHSSVWFLFLASNRWFGIWLELISCAFLTVVAFSFLTISASSDGGNIGLAIASVLTLLGSFQWGMRQSAETENYMTSVERAFEYVKLKPEAPLESKPDKKPPNNWPSGGQITFKNVFLTYDDKPVLKNLSFEILPQEKIGIIGRTGAGKSSIIAALFRMTEPQGDILIDGISTKSLGLHDLRKSISIIPQDPVLFSGTVRYNLDPFNQFKDDELWRVIEEVELKDAIPSLDFMVADSGSNFSVGQRQLICLSRALLRQNKIIVMDEATANVDPKTDALIQKTIRLKFSECTILTIAHRLHSIIDCSRILVLEFGNLEEYGHPHTLLQNPSGIFTSMVQQTGKNSAVFLKNMAANSYSGRSVHK